MATPQWPLGAGKKLQRCSQRLVVRVRLIAAERSAVEPQGLAVSQNEARLLVGRSQAWLKVRARQQRRRANSHVVASPTVRHSLSHAQRSSATAKRRCATRMLPLPLAKGAGCPRTPLEATRSSSCFDTTPPSRPTVLRATARQRRQRCQSFAAAPPSATEAMRRSRQTSSLALNDISPPHLQQREAMTALRC